MPTARLFVLFSIPLLMVQKALPATIGSPDPNCFVTLSGTCTGQTFQVQIFTLGTYYLEFDLTSATPRQDSIITISSFSASGTPGPSSQSGDVTGSLANQPVVLRSSTPLNQYVQQLTADPNLPLKKLVFDFDVKATSASGVTPDIFEVFVLDSSRTRYSTADPTGANALISTSFTNPATAMIFANAFGGSLATVPEPAATGLIVVGLACCVLAFRQRSQHP